MEENIWIPSTDLSNLEVYKGFEFDQISTDLFGNSRSETNSVGAINPGSNEHKPNTMDMTRYGTDWYDPSPASSDPNVLSAGTSEELVKALANAGEGDIIELTSDHYEIDASLAITKNLTIQSADTVNKSTISFIGETETPAFEMNPKGQLILRSVILRGTGENYAFASLRENMSSLYNLKVIDSEISDFDHVLKAYKYSFSEHIRFQSTIIKDCKNGLDLSGEDDNRGEYNAENLSVINCRFENVDENVVNYYRGGYDESTVGGNLLIHGSEFKQCGKKEKSGVLINTYGIINVDISENEFQNNPVKLVAVLWGAKNNTHSDNRMDNSGEIVVEQNLPQKLMY